MLSVPCTFTTLIEGDSQIQRPTNFRRECVGCLFLRTPSVTVWLAFFENVYLP